MRNLELQAQQEEKYSRVAPPSAPERTAAWPSSTLRQVTGMSAGYEHVHTVVQIVHIVAGVTPE